MKFEARYVPGPGGLGPVYWRNEASGVLPAAVREYADAVITDREMAPGQFALVKSYCIYWIDAPCWCWGDGGEFKKAAEPLRAATTRKALTEALRCLKVFGVDPF